MHGVYFYLLVAHPPSYGQVAGSHWPGEGLSTTTAGSDTEVKTHSPLKVIGNGDPPRSILYDRSSPRGSPNVPDLPPKPEVRFDLSHENPRSGSSQGSPRGQQGSPSGSQHSSPDPVKPADVDLSLYDSLPHHSLLSGKVLSNVRLRVLSNTKRSLVCFPKKYLFYLSFS